MTEITHLVLFIQLYGNSIFYKWPQLLTITDQKKMSYIHNIYFLNGHLAT